MVERKKASTFAGSPSRHWWEFASNQRLWKVTKERVSRQESGWGDGSHDQIYIIITECAHVHAHELYIKGGCLSFIK